ncbi:MAG: hypothetical protein HYX99_01110, partial [Chloroflexi bacterium]|nr:hypothetical protein [Chloroflexota bacterium]
MAKHTQPLAEADWLRRGIVALGLAGGALGIVLLVGTLQEKAYALDEHACLQCHGNPELTLLTSDGAEVSLYVNQQALDVSAHRYVDCTTCH